MSHRPRTVHVNDGVVVDDDGMLDSRCGTCLLPAGGMVDPLHPGQGPLSTPDSTHAELFSILSFEASFVPWWGLCLVMTLLRSR